MKLRKLNKEMYAKEEKLGEIKDFKMKDDEANEFKLSDLPKVDFLVVVNLMEESDLVKVQEVFFEFRKFGEIVIIGKDHFKLVDITNGPKGDSIWVLDENRKLVFSKVIDDDVESQLPELKKRLAALYSKSMRKEK